MARAAGRMNPLVFSPHDAHGGGFKGRHLQTATHPFLTCDPQRRQRRRNSLLIISPTGLAHSSLYKRHESGHYSKIDCWEVLNEPEIEHFMSRETYTRVYDAVVETLHRVSPETKFVGMAAVGPMSEPNFVEYFLNARNHKPGITLDMISWLVQSEALRS